MKTIPGVALTAAEFETASAAREPFVIAGLAANWPAVQAAQAGDEAFGGYLVSRANSRPQEVLIAPPEAKGRFFYRDGLDGMNFNRQQVSLPLFLEHLLYLREKADAPTLYIQSTPAPQIVPGFASENINPLLGTDVVPRLWIGNSTRVAAHFDVADNIAVVVAGRRRFTLFPPEQVKNLYIGPLDFTVAGQPVSLVDTEAPDLERYPLYREAAATAQTVELEPGDAIYIPSPWWHAVKALSPVNMLVNYWWRDYPALCGTPYNWLVHGLLSVRHLPKAERAAWRAMIDHYVFEDNGNPAEHIPDTARSVLGPMTSQLAQHLRDWLRKQFR